MSMMNPSQVRLYDPVLSTIALGYRQQNLVGMELFPRVPVQVSGGQVIQFGVEEFQLYDSERGPGGQVKQISFGYKGVKYTLDNHGLEGLVPREELRDASIIPGIDLGTRAVGSVMRALTLRLEYDQAALATNPANYDSNHQAAPSGTDLWTDGQSDPVAQVLEAREQVRATTGIYPNTMVLGALPFKALKTNPKIVEHIKYTGKGPVTTDILAGLFEVERVVVGAAVTSDPNANMSDVWGNNTILAYVPHNLNQDLNSMGEPSFGYTYTMDGNPLVEPPYYDQSVRSWKYPVFYERKPVLTGITSGFLFQNPA